MTSQGRSENSDQSRPLHPMLPNADHKSNCPQKSCKPRIRKHWLVPVQNTKWNNQETFTGKQVKKTNKRWLN